MVESEDIGVVKEHLYPDFQGQLFLHFVLGHYFFGYFLQRKEGSVLFESSDMNITEHTFSAAFAYLEIRDRIRMRFCWF